MWSNGRPRQRHNPGTDRDKFTERALRSFYVAAHDWGGSAWRTWLHERCRPEPRTHEGRQAHPFFDQSPMSRKDARRCPHRHD